MAHAMKLDHIKNGNRSVNRLVRMRKLTLLRICKCEYKTIILLSSAANDVLCEIYIVQLLVDNRAAAVRIPTPRINNE